VRVLRLNLAYDGTGFHGWARQRGHVRTVEGVLMEALERVLGQRPAVSAAGRTDSGVHAREQVVSFAAGGSVDPAGVATAVNDMLGPEVVVTRARWAPEGFDARLSATAREYRYRVEVGDVPDPFDARFVWHRPGEVSVPAMRRAARDLVGEHDFASFCRAPQGGGTTVRRLIRLSVWRLDDRVEITARANGFLHQMVRSLVGTLFAVGGGRMAADRMPDVLAALDRSAAWQIAPSHGLTLERVVYGRRGDATGRSSRHRRGASGR
jgi:tRNA pseudouridine38-40 synthase